MIIDLQILPNFNNPDQIKSCNNTGVEKASADQTNEGPIGIYYRYIVYHILYYIYILKILTSACAPVMEMALYYIVCIVCNQTRHCNRYSFI